LAAVLWSLLDFPDDDSLDFDGEVVWSALPLAWSPVALPTAAATGLLPVSSLALAWEVPFDFGCVSECCLAWAAGLGFGALATVVTGAGVGAGWPAGWETGTAGG
jgi:hypothetical protein